MTISCRRNLELALLAAMALTLMLAAACFRADLPENLRCANYDPPCPGSQECIDGFCRSPLDDLDENDAGSNGNDGGGPGTRVTTTFSRELDLLFVIDDSVGMTSHQEALISAFPLLLDVLDGEGELPDLHLGIVSTDVGADPTPLGEPFVAAGCEGDGLDGRLVIGSASGNDSTPSCAGISGSWIVDVADPAGGRSRNYQGDLVDRFACAANVGSAGCGFEMPLEALRRALDHPDNAGFFREGAVLGVIILSDEDDCSIHDLTMLGGDPRQTLEETFGPLSSFRCTDFGVRCDPVGCDEFPRELRCEGERQRCEPDDGSDYMYPPAHFAELLLDFMGGRHSDLVVATVVGDPEPFAVEHHLGTDGLVRAELAASCANAAGDADPAVRLHAFADAFALGRTASICESTLETPLEGIARDLEAALNQTCLAGEILGSDREQGPDCEVVELTREAEKALDACDEGQTNAPCWRAEPSSLCDTPSGLMLVIERGDTPAPPASEIRASCLLR